MERRWLVPAFLLVAIQQAACLIVGVWLRTAGSPPFINYGLIAISVVAIVIAVTLLRALFTSWRDQVDSPAAAIWNHLFVKRSQIAIFLFGFALGWLQLVALTWTKSLIPKVTDMWADPLLANTDLRLFGVDPWRLADPFLAPFGRAIDALYALWSIVLQLVFATVLLAPASKRKSRTLLTFFLTMALVGVLGQFLLPSGGPIFWSRLGFGHRFDALPSAPHTRVAADYLWRKYLGDTVDFATGISAFPSMHIAMTTWIVLGVHALFLRARPFAWAYFLIIFMGSVYLGWHYLVDGLGGAFGAIVCWYISSVAVPTRYVDKRRTHPAAQ